jgi:hypothetical protein
MRKPQPSQVTRTEELSIPDLPLRMPAVPPPLPLPERHPADKIKEALLRWLEEEL